jgi:ATP-binding cassette subfamily C protein
MIIWGLVLSFVTLVVPLSANTLFNEIIPNGDAPRLLWLFGVLLVVAVATLPLQVAFAASVSEVVNRSSHHHMRSLWSRIMRVPSDYVAALGRGEVVSRFVDLALVAQLVERQVLTNTPVMIAGAVALIAIVVVAPAPGLVIAILLAIILALGMMMTRRIDREQQRVSEGTAEMRSFLLTVFGALAKVRVTAAELIVFQRWTTLFRRVVGADLEKTQSRLSIFTTVLPELGTFVLIAAVSLVGLTTVDAGAFVALQYLVGVVVAGGVMLIFATIALQQQLPVLRRVLELSDSPLERGPGSGQDPGMLRGAIDLVGVSFTYPGTGRAILDDVTLSIQPGESVAIVGPSGSGKSTLLRLLLGFETPTNGVVLYDGRDMRNLDVLAVRRQLGVVLQDSALDSGQIRKNVSGPRRMRDPEIWAVLEAAAVADDIRAMPMRLETPLTFGGGGISGGQRQRLLIARALATQPRILVLDEATSALDNRAQATISANLDSMGITRLIVAHRLSTIRNADRIIVLDAGRIAQEGSYDELMADDTGIFSRFARRQMV